MTSSARWSGDGSGLAPSAHVDTFVRDNLPPREQWPVLRFDLPELRYPLRLNSCAEFLDRNVEAGRGDVPAVVTPAETLTYGELLRRVERIAHVLTSELGLVPGNRVLLRAANNAWMVAAYFAVLRAGGVVVATMPLLRAKEIGQILSKARITHALCDVRLRAELDKAAEASDTLRHVICWGDGDLEGRCARHDAPFPPCDTAADDVCLIGFTSGTSGEPKGTMHFHRDLLAICDSYGRHVLAPRPTDRFIGSPPLAFTFGLGGLVLFPFRVGATSVLLERTSPDDLLPAIEAHGATVCFTAPTAYRVMAPKAGLHDLSSLRCCVSAGETLPKVVFDEWERATGIRIMDGIGATEMLHIFVGSPADKVVGGATGLVVPGYVARIVDEAGQEVPRGTPGRLAVQGPTGCRYLADDRQRAYVQDGWNITGDTFVQDEDGRFWYQARNDDMIVSAGYNIAGPEVESCLLLHPAVKECGVVGAPDPERGMIVKAYVVPAAGATPGAELAKTLQDFVKAEIAPYKYPRAVEFVEALPRTETGKLQRFALRQRAARS